MSTEKIPNRLYFSDDQEPPSLDNHRYSIPNRDVNTIKAKLTDLGYQSSSTNYNRELIQNQASNSRQVYSNTLHKQPKSQTDVNCYQDNGVNLYNSGEKLKKKKSIHSESKSINHDQYISR